MTSPPKGTQSIPCPECQTPIHFEPFKLMQGEKFRCSNCDAEIGLSPDRSNEALSAIEQFERAKREATGG